MAYEAIVNGVDYTAQSWALIAPVWGALAALWLPVRRWPVVAALPLGAGGDNGGAISGRAQPPHRRGLGLLRCGLVAPAALLFGLLLLLLHRKERARNDKERCAFHLLAF